MTDLLDFARGPALTFSITVFVLGVVWRLVTLLALPHTQIAMPGRKGASMPIVAATGEFFRRMKANRNYATRTVFAVVNGWTFHIGLLIVVVGLAAHIAFLRQMFVFGWPSLPSNLVFLIGVLTLASLVAALVHRMSSPVLRLISTAGDYIAWLVTAAPVVTGLMATMHLGARYETLLALHILSVCAMLIWFPFGKLMHAFLVFITRSETGIQLAERGIKL